ncbi:MAG: ion transporter [Oxalobacteraceae bacterium]
MTTVSVRLPGWRGAIEHFVMHPWVQHLLVVLIVVNALILGLETDARIHDAIGHYLMMIDQVILIIFIAELVLLIAARGLHFFTDPWCVFDFIVVGIALVPATGSLSVLRALRVLRVLRLINKVESMRKVVSGLLASLPSLGSVFSLIVIIFYVASVIATNTFSAAFPELFGDMFMSAFTLFQVMTLEGWSEGIARPVMQVFPYAWIFFLLFILIATFVIVNLFIAVIVDSLNSPGRSAHPSLTDDEIKSLREEIAELRRLLIDQKRAEH